MKKWLIPALFGLFAVSACTTNEVKAPAARPEVSYETASQNQFLSTNYRAADHLIQQFQRISKGGALIVGTVVNIDALDQSSTLGRLVSEQVAARFSQNGYSMIEMKIRNSLYMKQSEGELMLSREINEVARNHNAQAVIVGSYGTSSDGVFVNLKVVQPGSNTVLAVTDYVLPMNRDIRSMLSRTQLR